MLLEPVMYPALTQRILHIAFLKQPILPNSSNTTAMQSNDS